MKISRSLILTLILSVVLFIPAVVFGQFTDGLPDVADATQGGYNANSSLAGTIGLLIQAFLGILGVIFLLLTIYAGFLWMTAAGDDGKVKQAKETLVRAVIGMVIVLAAYSITFFVLGYVAAATSQTIIGGV
ncbi:hypothetical protein KBC55_03570 [Patescibacteria group bacterium]|nr:hypothetical protein [Patescibacteria group bacterium]